MLRPAQRHHDSEVGWVDPGLATTEIGDGARSDTDVEGESGPTPEVSGHLDEPHEAVAGRQTPTRISQGVRAQTLHGDNPLRRTTVLACCCPGCPQESRLNVSRDQVRDTDIVTSRWHVGTDDAIDTDLCRGAARERERRQGEGDGQAPAGRLDWADGLISTTKEARGWFPAARRRCGPVPPPGRGRGRGHRRARAGG